tara:strand:+ start:510 stop:647 length:138 start_codon:yes stop_codon:yes gene_type:complete
MTNDKFQIKEERGKRKDKFQMANDKFQIKEERGKRKDERLTTKSK